MKPCWPEEILQAYLDGELPSAARANVAAHLAECTACAVRVKEAERTLLMIDSAWANEVPDAVPTARLRTRIDAALTEKAAPQFAWLWNWKLAAVAAALLLALATLFVWRTNKPAHEQRTVEYTRQNEAPPDNSVITTRTSATLPSGKSELRRGWRASQSRLRNQPRPRAPIVPEIVVATAQDSESKTDFIPLRYGDDQQPMESGEVIRVQMLRSALITFGLPVHAEHAGELIFADLLIGENGQARAIRFVR